MGNLCLSNVTCVHAAHRRVGKPHEGTDRASVPHATYAHDSLNTNAEAGGGGDTSNIINRLRALKDASNAMYRSTASICGKGLSLASLGNMIPLIERCPTDACTGTARCPTHGIDWSNPLSLSTRISNTLFDRGGILQDRIPDALCLCEGLKCERCTNPHASRQLRHRG